MTLGVVVLILAVVVALGFGSYRALTDGRFAGTRSVRGVEPGVERPVRAAAEADGVSLLAGTAWAASGGERATLLQFSSAFCAPCRVTRRTLEEVARITPGVAHVEVDAESHLDLVRRLDILRTPTTLILDSAGREVTRASGAPTKQAVLAGLAQAVGD